MTSTSRVALVTGGSKGIGLAMVKHLVAQGCQVITCSRHADTWLDCVAQEPALAGVDYTPLDIAETAQTEDWFKAIQIRYGQLDVAVNNASPMLDSKGTFEQVETADLQATLQQDFWSHALCLKLELALMAKGGAIVNISSVNGLRPTPNAAMYSAAKHALEGLTRSVALEAVKKGVRVNAVAPGVTWTPRWIARQQDEPVIRESVSEVVPIGRFAEPEEIVHAVDFLLSDNARYIIGHTLVVDGGLSLT